MIHSLKIELYTIERELSSYNSPNICSTMSTSSSGNMSHTIYHFLPIVRKWSGSMWMTSRQEHGLFNCLKGELADTALKCMHGRFLWCINNNNNSWTTSNVNLISSHVPFKGAVCKYTMSCMVNIRIQIYRSYHNHDWPQNVLVSLSHHLDHIQ